MVLVLNENIKTIRSNKGFTQEDLAVRLHVTRQTISKWEKGYSVPDADLLSRMAEILEVNVSDLLGEKAEANEQDRSVVDQLSRLNEQLAIKNRRARTIWKAVGIILLVLVITVTLLISFTITVRKADRQVAGSTTWECTLNGETYTYSMEYNKDYQILTEGGDAFIDYHTDIGDCENANEAAAHLKDYFQEHGGSVTTTSQEGLSLSE